MIIVWLSAITLATWTTLCVGELSREMACSMTLYPTANELAWECPAQKDYFIQEGLYSPRDMLPTRFQTMKDVSYLAFPRFRCGVAATLVAVNMEDFCRVDPHLTPYPSWQMNNFSAEAGLINVVDIFIDDLNVLWVLDIGVLFTLTSSPQFVSTPNLYAFCTKTGKLLIRVPLYNYVCQQSRLQHIQVEVIEEGRTYVYISDAGTASIIVLDVQENSGFKVALPSDVTEYPLHKDVLYLALIRKDYDQTLLYFTYLMGKKMYSIRACLIRDGKIEGGVVAVGCKPGPLVILGTDGGQTIYLRLRKSTEIFLWNTNKAFRPRSLVLVERGHAARYPLHVAPGYRHLMWVLDANFQDYMIDQHGSLGVLPQLAPLAKFCDATT